MPRLLLPTPLTITFLVGAWLSETTLVRGAFLALAIALELVLAYQHGGPDDGS